MFDLINEWLGISAQYPSDLVFIADVIISIVVLLFVLDIFLFLLYYISGRK